MKTLKFELHVTVPDDIEPHNVAAALNGALDEPPCNWGEWTVGAVTAVPRKPSGVPAGTDLSA